MKLSPSRFVFRMAAAPYVLSLGILLGYFYVSGVSKSDEWVAAFWQKYGGRYSLTAVIIGLGVWINLLVEYLAHAT